MLRWSAGRPPSTRLPPTGAHPEQIFLQEQFGQPRKVCNLEWDEAGELVKAQVQAEQEGEGSDERRQRPREAVARHFEDLHGWGN